MTGIVEWIGDPLNEEVENRRATRRSGFSNLIEYPAAKLQLVTTDKAITIKVGTVVAFNSPDGLEDFGVIKRLYESENGLPTVTVSMFYDLESVQADKEDLEGKEVPCLTSFVHTRLNVFFSKNELFFGNKEAKVLMQDIIIDCELLDSETFDQLEADKKDSGATFFCSRGYDFRTGKVFQFGENWLKEVKKDGKWDFTLWEEEMKTKRPAVCCTCISLAVSE
jgi:hypothetical protein